MIVNPLALDIDAGDATVASSRSKGKYREHLQPHLQDQRQWYFWTEGWAKKLSPYRMHTSFISKDAFEWQETHFWCTP